MTRGSNGILFKRHCELALWCIPHRCSSDGLFFLRDRRHARYAIENDYTKSLLDWHLQVVEIFLRLRLAGETSSNDLRSGELARLSALIEQGRFFFPNIIIDDFGNEKPPAYRGYRNLALDMLVASYNLFLGGDKTKKNRAETLQRHFTSIVFEIVRPAPRGPR